VNVNGQSPPYLLAGSDGANGVWSVRRVAGSWFASPHETGGVSDHGGLTGLADNDHPQYLLTSSFSTVSTSFASRITTLEDAPPSSGGGLPAITYVSGWANGNYYQTGSNVLASQTAYTLFVMFRTTEFIASGDRELVGTNDGFGGGVYIYVSGEGNYARMNDSTAALRTLSNFVPPATNKWHCIALRAINAGPDYRIQLYVNGSMMAEHYQAGASVSSTSGGNFTVGNRAGTDRGAIAEEIAGCGYALRDVTPAQIAAWSRACIAAGTMATVPGGLTAGWRATTGGAGGATWDSFEGSRVLTRTGTLATGSDAYPVYR
jgi:hypothetical protein